MADVTAKRAIVVDPGGDLELIRDRLAALGARVEAIVHTHTHIDHVGCTAELQRATGATASIHAGDRVLYDMLPVQAEWLGFEVPQRADMDDGLLDGQAVRAGGVELGVLHTPGHTPGSCSFVFRAGDHTLVLTGDTLFRRGIGRTDLGGIDSDTLVRSIRSKLLTLPDEAVVVAGHGPTTTIGEERARNPFLVG